MKGVVQILEQCIDFWTLIITCDYYIYNPFNNYNFLIKQYNLEDQPYKNKKTKITEHNINTMITLGKPTWGKNPTNIPLENKFNKRYNIQSYGKTNQ